jgi:hypothetical protein
LQYFCKELHSNRAAKISAFHFHFQTFFHLFSFNLPLKFVLILSAADEHLYVKNCCGICFFVKRAAKIGVFNLPPNNFSAYFSLSAETQALHGFQHNIFFHVNLLRTKPFYFRITTSITNIPLSCSTDFNISAF